MNTTFGYSFPAIRGIQAGREYYVSMCPLRLIPRIFLFDEEEMVPELRAQRSLNKARIPEMARYMTDSPEDYTFSALTASVDGEIEFSPIGEATGGSCVGALHIDMDARFIINDGQHRRAAIETAIRERPELADETIAVVFFLDIGLKRSQQMFADLNRYAIRPSRSLSLLYDHRDNGARLTKLIVLRSPIFKDVVDMEKSTLSTRSSKLFTLSSLHTANTVLFAGFDGREIDELAELATDYWSEIGNAISEWGQVVNSKMPASEVRQGFIHSHGIALQALGKVGNTLIKQPKTTWKKAVKRIKDVNWSRSNTRIWEGRAMTGGRVTKSMNNVTLTTNYLKTHLGLPLTPEEQRVEDAFLRGEK
jgi:DNA sulfur modification protein DndB